MLEPNQIINERYKVYNKIGAGSFGSIYLVKDFLTNNRVAVKLESSSASFPLVIYEANVTLLMHERKSHLFLIEFSLKKFGKDARRFLAYASSNNRVCKHFRFWHPPD